MGWGLNIKRTAENRGMKSDFQITKPASRGRRTHRARDAESEAFCQSELERCDSAQIVLVFFLFPIPSCCKFCVGGSQLSAKVKHSWFCCSGRRKLRHRTSKPETRSLNKLEEGGWGYTT